MSCFFIDLDGTLFLSGTNTPVAGAIEQLKTWQSQGHQIIITTLRPKADEVDGILEKLGVKPCGVLCGVGYPRIVINDSGGYGITHKYNAPWNYGDKVFPAVAP